MQKASRVWNLVSIIGAMTLASIWPGEPLHAAQRVSAKVKNSQEPLSFRQVYDTRVDMDVRAEQKRNEAIAKLNQLMPMVKNKSQLAELSFRLGEMYWAKAKFNQLRAMERTDVALEKWVKNGRKGKEPSVFKLAEHKRSRRYRKKALSLFHAILKKYPRYHRKDEVYYNLGSSYYEAGNKHRGVAMYWKMLKQYPKSEFAADAWLQLGEHFFNTGNYNLSKAVRAYKRAAASKKPRIYSFAVYKLAWCDFNLGQYKDALQRFRIVLDYAKNNEKGAQGLAQRDRIQLREEALADMVRVYSHLDRVDEAISFYTAEVGEKIAYNYLSKLASLFDKEGKWKLEIQLLDELNKRYPYAGKAPSNQAAIMNAYARLNQRVEVRQQVRRLIDLYSPSGVWASKNAGRKEILNAAFELVENELAGLVMEQHRAAQDTKLVETYKLARDIYAEYLDKFQNTQNSYQFRFFYAEILYELREFSKAAKQYVKVSQEKGKFQKAASYAAVLAWEDVLSGRHNKLGAKISKIKRGKAKGTLKQLGKLKKLQKGSKYIASELSDHERHLAAACDYFVKVAPQDPDVVKMKFKSARLYYIHYQFKEAAERFGEIVRRWPKNRLARLSAESIVQSFNVREDWQALNLWSRKFSKNKVLMRDKGFAAFIDAFVKGASFNEIHFLAEKKESAKVVADKYSAYATEFPNSHYTMVAMFNSLVHYERSHQLAKAMHMAAKLLRNYDRLAKVISERNKIKSEEMKLPKPRDIKEKSLFMNATFFERIAKFLKAAKYYEEYASEFPKGSKRADALYNAGIFRLGLKQYDLSIANFQEYIKSFPNKADVADIAWKIAGIHESKKDYSAAEKQYVKFKKVAGKSQEARIFCADYRILKSQLARGKRRKEQRYWQKLLKKYGSLKAQSHQDQCVLKAIGEAKLALVDPIYQRYLKLSLKVSQKKLGRRLLKKLGLVDQLQRQYTEVLATGHGTSGIAALYRIGKTYQHIATSLFDVRCPKRLTEDQCAIYQTALQDKAMPLEQKAIEAFQKASNKSYELGLYTSWLLLSQEALSTYEPARYPKVHAYAMMTSERVAIAPDVMEALK